MNGNGKQSINFQRNSLISHGPLSSIDSLVTMNALPVDEIDEKSRRGKEKVESPSNRMQTVDRGDESISSDLFELARGEGQTLYPIPPRNQIEPGKLWSGPILI